MIVDWDCGLVLRIDIGDLHWGWGSGIEIWNWGFAFGIWIMIVNWG